VENGTKKDEWFFALAINSFSELSDSTLRIYHTEIKILKIFSVHK
jgi:hypothetical protein